MTRDIRILAAFVLSGIAGLMYEVVWSRYLALYVGHSAYAQVLTLAVYLGGMAVGALVVADVSRRVARPLAWYVAAEVTLALFGLLFHPLFRLTLAASYDVLFPALGSASLVGGVRWGIAAVILLPQAIVLGTTFPFMAAGLVRADRSRPGGGVAVAYLLNTLGGATGVLLSGFVLITLWGLPSTLMIAATLNLLAALLVGLALRASKERDSGTGARGVAERAEPEPDPAVRIARQPRLGTVLLATACLTAVASFAYEIGWIRMLSLVLGSATHAFELMLSAFILGIGLGAWLVRNSVDRTPDPLRLLGRIQIGMGLAAVASLPLYLLTFSAMSTLVTELPRTATGYALFNLSRYGLCLLVMLPATVLAGMTLPVITGTLLRAGWGERSIGAVYGVNTIGSVIGAALAGLLLLPLLGLKGLLIAGAAVDVALGVWILERSARWALRRRVGAGLAGLAAAVALVLIAVGVPLNQVMLTSGVFRGGYLPSPGDREVIFYEDGRTATVSAHVASPPPSVVLSTNGKPDAGLTSRWFVARPDSLPPAPIDEDTDLTTQVLAPLVGLAHAPGAREIVAIGHGAGLSGVALLSGSAVERLVTVEIEPQMVEGSKVFLPVNEPIFNDPRSSFVFDDAKSYLAYDPGAFDIVFAEPSNLWVSGVAGLFTVEFYERLDAAIAPGGVLVQWIHIYELNDDLFLGILAALGEAFPHYRAYLVGSSDVAVVASREPLPDPDWSVLAAPEVRAMIQGTPPFTERHLDALFLFDEQTFAPVLALGVDVHSDFKPKLAVEAERARFYGTIAEGIYSLAVDRIDLGAAWREEARDPVPYELVPATTLRPLMDTERAAWIREAVAAGGARAPVQFPNWAVDLIEFGEFYLQLRAPEAWTEEGRAWPSWSASFIRADDELHHGTAGWADSTFYATTFDFLDGTDAPDAARAVANLMYGVNTFDWERAARAADILVPRVGAGEAWTSPTLLLDAAVLSYVKTGRPDAARDALDLLVPLTRRAPWNLRNRLLEALIGT